ncbi:MAG: hypothetical protein GX777_03065 [Fastidiosipila sp.]|nr:hypothetical protein [Fastidiosipila sp.]
MAIFTKYNNPNRKRRTRKSAYSQEYVEERRNEMYQLLALAESDQERDNIIKAFDVSIRPYTSIKKKRGEENWQEQI